MHLTKGLLKVVSDLEKHIETCPEVRLKQKLNRDLLKLKKALKIQHVMKGGESGLEDPRIYNVQGLIESVGKFALPSESDTSSGHLATVPAPFSAGNDMKSLELLPPDEVAKFVPDSYSSSAPVAVAVGGGASKKNLARKTNTKKESTEKAGKADKKNKK